MLLSSSNDISGVSIEIFFKHSYCFIVIFDVLFKVVFIQAIENTVVKSKFFSYSDDSSDTFLKSALDIMPFLACFEL